MNKRNSVKLAVCGAFLTVSSMAMAAEETANLNVSAVVLDSCTLTAATALAFASIDTSSASNEVTPGSVVVLCTGNRTGASVTLGGGENISGGTRRMASTGGAFLPYSVYADASRSSAIASGGTLFSGNITALVPQAIAVHGQVPAGSYSAGLYSDTILVTLTHN